MRKVAGNNSDVPAPAKADPVEPTSTLAVVGEPAKLKDADIKAYTGDDGSETFENSANADAAGAMKQNKVDAKAAEKGSEPERAYFHGQGGAAGL